MWDSKSLMISIVGSSLIDVELPHLTFPYHSLSSSSLTMTYTAIGDMVGTTAGAIDNEAMNLTLEAIQPCVTEEMNLMLCAQYSEEEVRIALFQMYPTKSPGPDGMPPLFFQHYWDSIGGDVTKAVQSFMHSGSLLT
ncbi:hypothetical protein M0R45_015018 [Rubus argutus]|uniref:Uncharacterized protein n=1 Tax=Rubus argutus TaxID=59490 RepID=A0AAW1XP96_RUBAR